MAHLARTAAQRLLLLEHNPTHQAIMSEVLAAAGYQIALATEGWAGLALARQQQPDLVLCADTLPGLDGYALLHLCRQAPMLQAIPFIMMGSEATWPALRRAMEQGADDYLPLPCEASALLRAVAARLLRVGTRMTAAISVPDGPASLAALAANYQPRLVARRQVVYAAGDEARYLYYIQAGRVKITKTTSFGKELITSIYHAHEFFGCKDLLERGKHYEAATAMEDTLVHCIPAVDFWQIIHWPTISLELIQQLAERKRVREEMLLDMAYHSLRRRLANTLLLLHEQAEANGEMPAYIHLTREDLAALVGITPESVSRTLSEFRHDHLLELTPRGIRLLQPDYLRLAEW